MMIDETELLERAALEDVHKAAPAEVVESLSLRPFNCAGAFVSLAGGLPASAIVLNRTIGLGLDVPATETAVRDIVGAYEDAGVARYFVHCHPRSAPRALPEWLIAAGLEPARGWPSFRAGPTGMSS